MPGRQAKVIVDPAVPDDVAALLRAHRRLLVRFHAGWAPARKRPRPVAGVIARAALATTSVTVAAYGLLLLVAGRFPAFVTIMMVATLLAVGGLVRPRRDVEVERREALERDVYDAARRYEGRYVLRDQLDEGARALLSRAQAAVDQVMTSGVHADGLLDGVRNAVMLPAQEWEVARLLAKLSKLRAEHREIVAEGVTREVTAAAEPLARALAGSEAAVAARVEALERYARHVADAERAYRARQQIAELSARLPRYEELLAESGADASAVPELHRLTQDAAALERALSQSVTSAQDAFRHLTPER
ncbi:hypothetical protein SAMN05421874_1367 [Nonomuraea maritima]|uniref:Uncharacterized protein n=1 Tax=Nonomuraea maritima TaxID=683260 RepID=A0A1G9PWJ0_9ACTN|nr:hypothetical protein [Nonomuraea maritima]SDM02841.1 hypothetical protein SAMN05421874_1367 [Nonomuraea maritima]